jgi:hypothetical protein
MEGTRNVELDDILGAEKYKSDKRKRKLKFLDEKIAERIKKGRKHEKIGNYFEKLSGTVIMTVPDNIIPIEDPNPVSRFDGNDVTFSQDVYGRRPYMVKKQLIIIHMHRVTVPPPPPKTNKFTQPYSSN